MKIRKIYNARRYTGKVCKSRSCIDCKLCEIRVKKNLRTFFEKNTQRKNKGLLPTCNFANPAKHAICNIYKFAVYIYIYIYIYTRRTPVD